MRYRNIILIILLAVFCGMQARAEELYHNNHKFTWGAELGGSIDMTGNDQSTIDIDAYFGYSNSFVKLLGVGANINMMVSDSNRSFPVYAIFRTNFRKTPSLLFMDLRGGVSVNCIGDTKTQSGLYLSGGLGINLATGKTFSSHLIVSYGYFERKTVEYKSNFYPLGDLHTVSMRIGVSF